MALNNLRDEALRRWQAAGLFISVENRFDSGRFSIGRISVLNEDLIAFSLVDVAGRFDGFKFYKSERLGRCSAESRYAEVLRELASATSDLPDAPNIDSVPKLLEYLREGRIAVLLRDSNDEVLRGFVKNFDATHVELIEFDLAWARNGSVLIEIDDIDSISFGGPDQAIIEHWIMTGAWVPKAGN